MDELTRLWQMHLEAKYPDGNRGKEVAGIELILLDADIAGCVSTYLAEGGRLDLQRTAILGRCYRDAAVVVSELPSPARDYFARLERMAAVVLEALSAAKPPAL